MNDQECIFKRYLTSCSADKIFPDKSLTNVRKQKVIDSSIQRKDDLYTHINDISLAYHKLCYTAYTSKEKIERHKKRRFDSNVLYPESSKRRRLFLIYLEKKTLRISSGWEVLEVKKQSLGGVLWKGCS